jgi:hypothetical protein
MRKLRTQLRWTSAPALVTCAAAVVVVLSAQNFARAELPLASLTWQVQTIVDNDDMPFGIGQGPGDGSPRSVRGLALDPTFSVLYLGYNQYKQLRAIDLSVTDPADSCSALAEIYAATLSPAKLATYTGNYMPDALDNQKAVATDDVGRVYTTRSTEIQIFDAGLTTLLLSITGFAQTNGVHVERRDATSVYVYAANRGTPPEVYRMVLLDAAIGGGGSVTRASVLDPTFDGDGIVNVGLDAAGAATDNLRGLASDGDGNVWAAESDGTLFQIVPAAGEGASVVTKRALGGAFDVAIDGDQVFVTTSGRTVTVIDRTNILNTLATLTPPLAALMLDAVTGTATGIDVDPGVAIYVAIEGGSSSPKCPPAPCESPFSDVNCDGPDPNPLVDDDNEPVLVAFALPTPTPTPTVTETPTETPTNTPTVSETPTETPTNTPTVSETPTETPTDTPTVTETPTETPADTPTVTETPTEIPTATRTPVPLNHFQCYEVHAPKMSVPGITLDDQFGPGVVELKKPKRLCNPADKNGEDPTAPGDPDHLTGYKIKQTSPRFARLNGVTVRNQFGTIVVDVVKPDLVLVPSAKSLAGPPGPLSPPVIEHFKCYKVKGARVEASVTVRDQFTTQRLDVKKPLKLCVPADKNGEGIFDASQNLMCYKVRAASPAERFTGAGTVFVNNQFGDDSFGVYRPTELCVPSSDPVELRALEVNQAVQDWHNSVTLVKDKPTVVRAFVQTKPGKPNQTVVGQLFGKRDGHYLEGSPLAAVNPGGRVLVQQDIVPRRGKLADSLNFKLPPSWVDGTVELRFAAGQTPVDCKEPSGPGGDPADDCIVTASFTPQTPPRIVYVAVKYRSGASTLAPTMSDLREQKERSLTIFPTASIRFDLDVVGTFPSAPTLEDVNSVLELKRFLERFLFGRSRGFLYYGVLVGTKAGEGGLANGIPGEVASGYLARTEAVGATGYARNRGPHEQAHDAGRHHAVDGALPLKNGRKQGRCALDSAPNNREYAGAAAPDHTPFENVGGKQRPVLGSLSTGPDNEVWGLDNRFVPKNIKDLAVVDPQQTFELMSYCGRGDGTGDATPQGRWISKYTYEGLKSGFPAVPAARVSVTASGDFLVVRGLIRFETDSADLKPTSFISGTVDTPDPGDYRAQLLDSMGAEIAGIDFEPVVMDADSPESGSAPPPAGLVLVPIPMPTAPVARIAILHGGSVIGSVDASANPPAVAITSPTAGETLSSDEVTFEWTASDPDGGTLWSSVLYSSDDGTSWDVLAIDLTDTELTIERNALTASTTARLRVLVSDGVKIATATSDQFSVVNNGPTVAILSPADGQSFAGANPVQLEAMAFDREDGALDGAIEWLSDLDGALGTGSSLDLVASDLSAGTHVITASATDASLETGSDSVTIQISP